MLLSTLAPAGTAWWSAHKHPKCCLFEGLVLNEQPLLDYAAAGDSRVHIEGDVERYLATLRPT